MYCLTFSLAVFSEHQNKYFFKRFLPGAIAIKWLPFSAKIYELPGSKFQGSAYKREKFNPSEKKRSGNRSGED